ncbi:MAG: VWA domain-containing protein [Gammaproteobacteria bacterium]|nr:VWA domain-containing protein [Gammaproteobacteria bacterium]
MNYSMGYLAATIILLQACTLTGQDVAVNAGSDNEQPGVDHKVEDTRAQPSPATEKKQQERISRHQPAPHKAKTAMHMEQSVAYGALQSMTYTPVLDQIRMASEPVDRENYKSFDDNPVKRVAESPVSTFSIDVDTGAYSNMRRVLNQGRIPNRQAIRTEELINYFSYDYPRPDNQQRPFNVVSEIAPAPWNKDSYLLHLGLQGYDIQPADLPPANLVFLVDVSGSMQSQDKLGLLKSGLKLLVKQMDKNDRISLVVYAGASGVVLEPTAGDQQIKITRALEGLTAGGSTNGAAGIRLAYQMAKQAFIKDGINRILLATDGDFNVGTTNFDALKQLVEQERKQGVALTTLGFGSGNYNDHLMEQLADAGNGNYSYIDNLNEARKVLVEQMGSTLNTIAKDVKIQIEFNPAVVAEYRLIGYENRALKREDFNNDKIDAGEIGAGHSVTALYEISLHDSKSLRVDELRYGTANGGNRLIENSAKPDELAFIRLRYKQPGENNSRLIEQPLRLNEIKTGVKHCSDNYRFAAAVAAFGQQLRGGQYLNDFDYDDIMQLARGARGKDAFAYRGEFIQLVALAKSLN